MVSTKPTGDQTFLLNGGATVRTHQSGVFVNSNGSKALFMNGGAKLDLDSNAMIVGGYGYNGGATWKPGITTGVPQLTMPDPAWAKIPAPPTPPTCSGNGSINGTVLSPGNFTNITLNGGKNYTMNPGVYCISGSFNLNGSANLSGSTGTVSIVSNSNVTINGGDTLTFNDLEIYTTNGTWTLNGSTTANLKKVRFYATGSANWIVNGGSTFTSDDAYFYLHSGTIIWNGSSTLNLHAPPAGDPYAGLLIYMPWNTNTNYITMNGGSNIKITGTYLAPHCPMTFNGSLNASAVDSQIIASTFIVNGGTTVDVTYKAADNWSPPQAAIVELAR